MRTLPAAVSRTLAIVLTLWSAISLGQGAWSESYRAESAGDYAAAIAALEPVIRASPDHELAVLRIAWLKYLLGDYNESLRDYERAAALNPQSLEAQLGSALPLLAQRRWREASVVAQQVLAVAPLNYYAHVRLMVAEEGERQWETLARHARELSARYPSDATFLVYLARAEARQGNLDAAVDAYSKVLERYPSHEEAAAFLERNQ